MPIVRAVSQAPSTTRSRSVSAQFAYGIADQAIVAVSSIAVVVVFARSLTAQAFGAVALVLLARVFVIDLGRAAIATPAQLDDQVPHERAAPLVGAVLLGALAGAIGLSVAAFVSEARHVLVIIALALPFQVLLEVVRFLLVADRRTAEALLLDGGVITVQATMVAATIFLNSSIGPTGHLIVWVGASTVASVLGFTLLATASPSVGAAREWWGLTGHVRRGLVCDTMWSHLHRQSVTWFLGGIGSLAVVAGFRGSQTGFRPLALIISGVRIVAVPAFRRVAQPSSFTLTVRVSGCLALGATMVLLALLALPDNLGRAAFGDTWAAMQPLLIPVGLAQIGQAAAVGPQVGLIAAGATDVLARTRKLVVMTLLIGAVVGGLAAGPVAAVWVLGVLSLIQVFVWWHASTSLPVHADPPLNARSLTEVIK